MNQLSLLSEVSERIPWMKGEIVFSLSFDQTKIIKDIMRLYMNGQPFDVDCTYSKGVFWRKLPEPLLKFDIAPQREDVMEASADNLPLQDESVQSIMFDPPFMPTKSPNNAGKIKTRFSSFSSVTEMWGLYKQAMREFWRVLQPGGIIVVKCQDTVSSGVNYFSHYEVETYARECGFEQLDLFVLGSKRVIISSTWKTQHHARKNHSFMLVFGKPVPKGKRKNAAI